MSIELAEQLKKHLTDKYVVVSRSVPELKRFANLTGFVKTVNMNGRALVQFNGPEDIGWYDIAPEYLTVVDAPPVKHKPHGKAHAEKPSERPAAKPSAAPKTGKSPLERAREQGAAGASKPAPEGKKLSPLELTRQQGAAGSAGAKAPEVPKPTPAATEARKLSPLELARMQDGGKAAAAPPAPKAEAAAAPASTPPAGKKLSPLELARLQDGKKKPDAPSAAAVEEPAPAAGLAKPAAPAPKPAASGFVPTPGDTAGIIALARQQGAFKG